MNRHGALRIGVLHPYQLGTSGSGVYLSRLVDQLVALGHHVTVLSHDEEITDSRGGPVRRVSLRSAGTPVAYSRADEPGQPLFVELSDAALDQYLRGTADLVEQAVGEHGIQVLHVNSEVPMSYVGAEVSRRCGTPYVVVGHGSTLEYVARADVRFAELCRTGFANAASVVALNDDVRRRMLAVSPDLSPRLIHIPPGVDCSLFEPADAEERQIAAPVVTYVGRLSVEKGVFHLVGTLDQLAEKWPGVRVRVVGDGVGRALLERMHAALVAGDAAEATRAARSAADPGQEPWIDALVHHWTRRSGRGSWPPVEFVGYLPPAGVAREVARADVVVVPSLVHEAFPLIVLEALAAGTPAVCADHGGLSAVLREVAPALGELGELMRVPMTDGDITQSLQEVVARLLGWLEEGGRRDAVRRTCRELAASQYDWPRVAKRLECLYAAARDRQPAAMVRGC